MDTAKQSGPETRAIETGNLLESVQEMRNDGYRLVQICATKTKDGYELDYSFDRNHAFVNLEIRFAERIELPSVTNIFPGAYLYENEIQEQFGIPISGINVNFGGHLYGSPVKHAFAAEGGDGA